MLTPVDPGDGGLGDVCTGCHGNDAPRHRCSGYNPNNRSRVNPAAASAFRLPAIQQPSTAQRATSRRPINVDELEHEPVAPSMAAATQRWSRSSPGGQRWHLWSSGDITKWNGYLSETTHGGSSQKETTATTTATTTTTTNEFHTMNWAEQERTRADQSGVSLQLPRRSRPIYKDFAEASPQFPAAKTKDKRQVRQRKSFPAHVIARTSTLHHIEIKNAPDEMDTQHGRTMRTHRLPYLLSAIGDAASSSSSSSSPSPPHLLLLSPLQWKAEKSA